MITKVSIGEHKVPGSRLSKVLSWLGCIFFVLGVSLFLMGFIGAISPIGMGVGALMGILFWIDIGLMQNLARAEKSKNK